ncbi:glutamate 5-kinase [Prochlorococcus sp. MIT 1307]|uniref:glutamate 5-kinase n=1 Tax=Prochlorococcus sp. MIT 1307 TaxID=3096219 RepID=UPI002A752EF7|nr:glutamate 5-kinase [Prochlorococcus sp. MIT 1307]
MTLWVIKIGTSVLRGTKEKSTAEVIDQIGSSIALSKNKGDSLIVVSSGAVGLGCHRLGKKERPNELANLQASAAVGQVQLMAHYESCLKFFDYKVAQILVTRADFESRESFRNVSMTLRKLLEWGIVPIVNENDAVSTEELKCGDNDTLSALVATAVTADQLILLTDVDRLYSADPRTNIDAQPISDVLHPKELKSLEGIQSNAGNWGTGGIKTKLAAARIATSSGITVHLADGRNPKILKEILKGARGGTVFHPHPKPMGTRKSWLAHALKPVGSIHLDKGACDAIQNKGASLLLVGVKQIEGHFAANQAVKIIDTESKEIARGISSLSSETLQNALRSPKTGMNSPLVVHRDVLVLTDELLS